MVERISLQVNASFVDNLSFSILFLESKVPLFLQKMREDSHSQWSKLVENVRKQSPVMNFEVKTSFIGQSHYFLKDETYILYEKRIDE